MMGDVVGQKVEELKRLMQGVDNGWTEEDYLEAALDAIAEEALDEADREAGLSWSAEEIEKLRQPLDDEAPW
jgi:hypothetical protein